MRERRQQTGPFGRDVTLGTQRSAGKEEDRTEDASAP